MGMPDQAVPIRVTVRGTRSIQWQEKFVFRVSMDMDLSVLSPEHKLLHHLCYSTYSYSTIVALW